MTPESSRSSSRPSGGEELEGTALRIYLYLLENGPAGPRQVARALGVSPSTAHRHLKRLAEAGLVRETVEGYEVVRLARIEGFIYLGRRLVPRLLVYSGFYAGLTLGWLAWALIAGPRPELLLLAATNGLASLLMVLEGLTALRRLRG